MIGAALLYIYGTEIIIKEALLNRLNSRDQVGLSDLQRLEGLDSILTAIERWFEVFDAVPLSDWIGTTFSIFAQFSHCIIILSKLTNLDEPGWDTDEVRRRADLLDILERLARRLDSIPRSLGLVDAIGTGESGIFFKSSRLIRGMKACFLAEMASTPSQKNVQFVGNHHRADFVSESSVPDDLVMQLANDPWLMDIFVSSWEV